MNTTQLIYLVFSGVILLALILDLGLLSKKNAVISLKTALIQTIFWVLLSLAFCGFIWFERGKTDAIQYISAYLLEWSLSIDNIFVFIIIFTFFQSEARQFFQGIADGDLDGHRFQDHFYYGGKQPCSKVRLDHVCVWGIFGLYRYQTIHSQRR